MTTRHDVVVIGGGNAGISLAARLRLLGCRDVCVVAPDQDHLYRPLLSFVAGGQARFDRLTRPMASVVPDGCTWVRGRAVEVDPERRTVTVAPGARVAGRDDVVAPRPRPRAAAQPALAAA